MGEVKLTTGRPRKPPIRSEPEKNQLTAEDILGLMKHDSYRRVKRRMRQKYWAECR